jgi:hypothetical protein
MSIFKQKGICYGWDYSEPRPASQCPRLVIAFLFLPINSEHEGVGPLQGGVREALQGEGRGSAHKLWGVEGGRGCRGTRTGRQGWRPKQSGRGRSRSGTNERTGHARRGWSRVGAGVEQRGHAGGRVGATPGGVGGE